jgi:hypothetical protein
LPFGVGPVRSRALDGDPLACAAARDRQLCTQTSRRRHALAPGEERRADILAVWEARKDISLEELRASLIELGLHVSVAGLNRFFARHGMTRKKRLAMPSSRTGPTS